MRQQTLTISRGGVAGLLALLAVTLTGCGVGRVTNEEKISKTAPEAMHTTDQYANNRAESDPGRLKSRLRPMRGLNRYRSAHTLAAGHAFMQNLRCGHYDIATDLPARDRLGAAFNELILAV
jgi:hypothetical protein